MDFGRDDYNQMFSQVQSNIPEEEPVFLLRASDPFCPIIVFDYLSRLTEHQADPEVIDSLIDHVQKIRRWQQTYGTKNADLVRMDQSKVDKIFRVEQILEQLEVDSKITSDAFNELQDIVTSIYGTKSFSLLMPNQFEYDGQTKKFSAKVGLPIESKLVLGLTTDKTWIILMNKL